MSTEKFFQLQINDICWIYYDDRDIQNSYGELVKVISEINNTKWYEVEILWRNYPIKNGVVFCNTSRVHEINLIKCNVLELAKLRLTLDNAVHDIIKNATK